jgi:hypothetical protein
VVAVLQQLDRLADAPGAEVDRHHRLGAGPPAPGGELVDPDLVGLDRAPGEVQPPGPILGRADPVLPAVVGDEVAAGVAQDRGPELAHQLEHVAAEAAVVGGGVTGLVDPGVDASPHVLDERPEQAAVDGPDPEGGVEGERGGRHRLIPTALFASL